MKTVKDLQSLRGRVGLITGGSGHLGKVFAETLLELGATVCLTDVAEDPLASFQQEIESRFPDKVSAWPMDVADESTVKKVVRDIQAKHGQLDIVVNNAAYPPSESISDEKKLWELHVQVMLTGTYLVTRATEPLLRQSGKGTIINLGSIYGCLGPDPKLYEGTEMKNPVYYAASKGGVLQLTRYWATTLAPAIRCNCIMPGGILRNQPKSFRERYVERTPLRRMGTEEDLKGAMTYFSTDMSAYVTGQALIVDGGYSAW